MKKWIDALFAWALVLLGSAHFLAAFVPKLAVMRGPWTEGAAVAIVTMGLMNAVRTQRSSDRFLRWSTAAATLLTAGLCLMPNLLHQPVVLAAGALAVIELVFAVAG